MTVAEVIPIKPQRTLGELRQSALDHHSLVQEGLLQAIQSAIACGEALIEAHELVGQSSWAAWVEENLTFARSLAHSYMRLARYKDVLPAEAFEPTLTRSGRVVQPSVSKAIKYLRGLPPIFEKPAAPVSPETKAEAKRLRATGLSYDQIADLLGISKAIVYVTCNPHKRTERIAAGRARRKRESAARRALADQERLARLDRTAKEIGGLKGKAYDHLRGAIAAADKARLAESTPQGRAEAAEMLSGLYVARDAWERWSRSL